MDFLMSDTDYGTLKVGGLYQLNLLAIGAKYSQFFCIYLACHVKRSHELFN